MQTQQIQQETHFKYGSVLTLWSLTSIESVAKVWRQIDSAEIYEFRESGVWPWETRTTAWSGAVDDLRQRIRGRSAMAVQIALATESKPETQNRFGHHEIT